MNRLIRYAKLEDAKILGKIHSESAQAGFRGIIPDNTLEDVFSIERRTKRFINELSEGSPKTGIVFEGNKPAGLISFGGCRYGNDDKSWIEIWRVYLMQEFWGNGAAKDLIEWGINEITKENFENIELWVLEENIRARNFYEKIGFQHDNVHKVIDGAKELRYTKIITK